MSWAEAVQVIVAFGLPMLSFHLARRRTGHTRAQLVFAAAIGGGIAGAIVAIVSTIAGASLEDAFPFAAFALGFGVFVGLLGLALLSLGRWLSRLP
jgi:hypothetical protein